MFEDNVTIECFRLELHHVYKIEGKSVKIDDPLLVECVMPLGERFGPPRYNKQDIVRMLFEKLVAYMKGGLKNENSTCKEQ